MFICGIRSKSKLASWIEDHTFSVMCPLAQLYLFENCDFRNHWRKEVWSNLKSMQVLKRKNKLPDSKFIFKNSWKVNESFVQDAVNWAIDHEEGLTPRNNIDISYLHDIMENYFKWISDELSKHKIVTSSSVYAKLDDLGLKI